MWVPFVKPYFCLGWFMIKYLSPSSEETSFAVGGSRSKVSLTALLRNLSGGQKLPITRKYQHLEPIIRGISL